MSLRPTKMTKINATPARPDLDELVSLAATFEKIEHVLFSKQRSEFAKMLYRSRILATSQLLLLINALATSTTRRTMENVSENKRSCAAIKLRR